MSIFRSGSHPLLATLAAVLAGCGDYADRAPLAPAGAPGFSSAAAATLLECPLDVAASATGTINPTGGVLRVTDSAGGTHELVFPFGAITVPTIFTMTVPASQYAKVRIAANDPITGALKSVTFPAHAQPTLAISYKRCAHPRLRHQTLRLYNIDEQTGALLEGPFGGEDGDSTDPRVVGSVPHFSEYAIGSPD